MDKLSPVCHQRITKCIQTHDPTLAQKRVSVPPPQLTEILDIARFKGFTGILVKSFPVANGRSGMITESHSSRNESRGKQWINPSKTREVPQGFT